MKKYLFFAGLACVAFGFVGCGSDDDGGSSKTPITLTEGSTAEESVFVTLTDGGKEEFLSYVEEEEKEGKDAIYPSICPLYALTRRSRNACSYEPNCGLWWLGPKSN